MESCHRFLPSATFTHVRWQSHTALYSALCVVTYPLYCTKLTSAVQKLWLSSAKLTPKISLYKFVLEHERSRNRCQDRTTARVGEAFPSEYIDSMAGRSAHISSFLLLSIFVFLRPCFSAVLYDYGESAGDIKVQKGRDVAQQVEFSVNFLRMPFETLYVSGQSIM